MGPGLLTAMEPKGEQNTAWLWLWASCLDSYHLASSLELPLESQSESNPVHPCCLFREGTSTLLCTAGRQAESLIIFWQSGGPFSGSLGPGIIRAGPRSSKALNRPPQALLGSLCPSS